MPHHCLPAYMVLWFNKDEMTEEFHKQYADFIITAVYQSLASAPTSP